MEICRKKCGSNLLCKICYLLKKQNVEGQWVMHGQIINVGILFSLVLLLHFIQFQIVLCSFTLFSFIYCYFNILFCLSECASCTKDTLIIWNNNHYFINPLEEILCGKVAPLRHQGFCVQCRVRDTSTRWINRSIGTVRNWKSNHQPGGSALPTHL